MITYNRKNNENIINLIIFQVFLSLVKTMKVSNNEFNYSMEVVYENKQSEAALCVVIYLCGL